MFNPHKFVYWVRSLPFSLFMYLKEKQYKIAMILLCPVQGPWASSYFLFLFSENYLSTIFYSDIIETVIYSDYICCKCSPFSTRFQWQYNPRHDCVAFKIHHQADNHSFLPPSRSPFCILCTITKYSISLHRSESTYASWSCKVLTKPTSAVKT